MIVVKLGGAAGNAEAPLLDELAAWPLDDEPLVLVHGASAAADALERRLGREPRHATSPSGHRYRVTHDEALEALVMAAADRNRRLVAALQAAGVPAVGLSGADGGLVTARRKRGVRARVGDRVVVVRDRSGVVERVRPLVLVALQEAGLVPVVTLPAVAVPDGPDGADDDAGENGEDAGGPADADLLNVDADRMAAALAAELEARALVLLTDVPGLLSDPDDEGTLVPRLARADLDEALETLARGRFKRKLLAAAEALDGGVPRVVVADSRVDRPLELALKGEGTEVVP